MSGHPGVIMKCANIRNWKYALEIVTRSIVSKHTDLKALVSRKKVSANRKSFADLEIVLHVPTLLHIID